MSPQDWSAAASEAAKSTRPRLLTGHSSKPRRAGGRVLEVSATAVRLKGIGAVLQERPKSEAGWRVITLPDRTAELCRRRLNMSWPSAHITVSPAASSSVDLM